MRRVEKLVYDILVEELDKSNRRANGETMVESYYNK